MPAFWTEADFDDHESVTVVRDVASGLTAILAIHSTHLGPAAGGTRFWHYADPALAMRDALRLSRGMSYKNAMAQLPMGGGKAVILADAKKHKTPAMLAAFGDAVEALGGRYVTAADVGINEARSVRTPFPSHDLYRSTLWKTKQMPMKPKKKSRRCSPCLRTLSCCCSSAWPYRPWSTRSGASWKSSGFRLAHWLVNRFVDPTTESSNNHERYSTPSTANLVEPAHSQG